jgi:hypothetical protein
MGDRGQIEMCFDESPSVFLYTHWRGCELKQILASALHHADGRWHDDEYVTAIIFRGMIADRNDDDLIWYGIGPDRHGDLNEPLIQVSTEYQKVFIEEEKWTFPEFVRDFHLESQNCDSI